MHSKTIDAFIASMIHSSDDVSDLIFMAGKPPLVESHGRLHEFQIDTPDSLLTNELIEEIADHIMEHNDRLLALYADTGSCDTSYEIEGIARLRVNIYKQHLGRAIVMRRFPTEIPTLAKLGLPQVFQEPLKEKNGIILVTGAAGSGKSTTLAAMLNELNQTEAIHLLTLEDPIEFIHPPGRAAISQRELGRDFLDFASGLRAALRQAPNGILVGEIRDRETMEIALNAAETGHVVYSTLHTINAGQTINRIIGFFSKDEEDPIRYRLSDTIRYIISQRLVPKVGGGRLLVTEVIGNSLRTRESIRYGESDGKTFQEIIDAGTVYGWHSFDQRLLQAFEAGLVNEETAILYCNDKGKVHRALKTILKVRGQKDDATTSLKLDLVPPRATKGDQGGEGDFAVSPDAAGIIAGGGGHRRTIRPRAGIKIPSDESSMT